MDVTNCSVLGDEWIDRDELAKELKVSVRTLNRWTFAVDGIPHVKIGAKTLYRRKSVTGWLADRETRPSRRRGRAA
ncbi:MAG: helix-turn-helix domain-containing protein [Xanthobacteraceae bacterium]|nr:helix-turn-helix domain-containing protein [Xanthobacteraceae bacterium]